VNEFPRQVSSRENRAIYPGGEGRSIWVNSAHDDAGVGWISIMQAGEIIPVMGENRVAKPGRVLKHNSVWNAFVGQAGINCGHNFVTEFAKQHDCRVRKILIGEQSRHLRNPPWALAYPTAGGSLQRLGFLPHDGMPYFVGVPVNVLPRGNKIAWSK
jgi:hypothetical protein